MSQRMFKKAFQQGRSEQRGEAYSLPYGEPLRDARTMLEDFFNILLELHLNQTRRHNFRPQFSP